MEELVERVQPTFEFMGYVLKIFEKRSLLEKNFYQNSLAFYALSCLKSNGFDLKLESLKDWLKQKVYGILDGKEPISKLFESDNFLALCFGIKALIDFDNFSFTQNRMDNFKKITSGIVKRTWLEDIRNPSVFLFCFNKNKKLNKLTDIARKDVEGKYQHFKAEDNVPQQVYSILGLSSLGKNLDSEIEAILERHKLDTTLLSMLLLSSKEKVNRNRIYHKLVDNLQGILDTFRPYLSDFLSSLQLKKLDFNEEEMNKKVGVIKIKNTSRWKFEIKLLESLKSINLIDICLAIISAHQANLLKTYGIISKDQLETFRKGKDIVEMGFFPFKRTELSFLILLLYIPFTFVFFLLLPPIIGWGTAIAVFVLLLELTCSFIYEGSFKRDKLYTSLKKVWDRLSKVTGS